MSTKSRTNSRSTGYLCNIKICPKSSLSNKVKQTKRKRKTFICSRKTILLAFVGLAPTLSTKSTLHSTNHRESSNSSVLIQLLTGSQLLWNRQRTQTWVLQLTTSSMMPILALSQLTGQTRQLSCRDDQWTSSVSRIFQAHKNMKQALQYRWVEESLGQQRYRPLVRLRSALCHKIGQFQGQETTKLSVTSAWQTTSQCTASAAKTLKSARQTKNRLHSNPKLAVKSRTSSNTPQNLPIQALSTIVRMIGTRLAKWRLKEVHLTISCSWKTRDNVHRLIQQFIDLRTSSTVSPWFDWFKLCLKNANIPYF